MTKGNVAVVAEITETHPNIHKSGSVRGMKERGYWGRDDVTVRIGDYIYNLSITLSPYRGDLRCPQGS